MNPFHSPGEKSLCYKICRLFTHSIHYFEVWLQFSGERGGGGVLFRLMGFVTAIIFRLEGSFQGVNFTGEILRWRDLPEFFYEICPISLLFFAESILRVEMLRVIVQGIFF